MHKHRVQWRSIGRHTCVNFSLHFFMWLVRCGKVEKFDDLYSSCYYNLLWTFEFSQVLCWIGENENLGHSELLHTIFPKGKHNQILKVKWKLAWENIMRAKRSREMCHNTDGNCGVENMKAYLMYPESWVVFHRMVMHGIRLRLLYLKSDPISC